jgi:hypothetical protein
MPKSPPPGLTQRDCRFDHLVLAALAKGYGVVLVYSGITTLERGHEVRRGVYRCARHREVSADAGPARLVDGDEMGLRAAGGEFELRFRLWSKRAGRRRVLDRHGPDRTRWPYDPRRPKSQDDIDYWATLGLNEKGHRVQ